MRQECLILLPKDFNFHESAPYLQGRLLAPSRDLLCPYIITRRNLEESYDDDLWVVPIAIHTNSSILALGLFDKVVHSYEIFEAQKLTLGEVLKEYQLSEA